MNSPDPDLDLIDGNLWLGNLAAATDADVINSRGINHILTIDSCPLPGSIGEQKCMKTMYIEARDTANEDLLSHFDDTFSFIEDGIKNGSVLVHCYFGVSRSATIVVAFLMKKYEMTLAEAMDFAKKKRRFIGPNPGFMAQLELFEVMKFNVDKNNIQYKMFRLCIAACNINKFGTLDHSCCDVIQPDPSLIASIPDRNVFRCRKCRRIVALQSSIIPHVSEEDYSWMDKRLSENGGSDEICSKTYFIEPQAWMKAVSETREGKLYCPNKSCQCKLGSFSWTKGSVCPCGTKVSPAFYLIQSKVDRDNNIQATI